MMAYQRSRIDRNGAHDGVVGIFVSLMHVDMLTPFGS
jgi:hypothetical protein